MILFLPADLDNKAWEDKLGQHADYLKIALEQVQSIGDQLKISPSSLEAVKKATYALAFYRGMANLEFQLKNNMLEYAFDPKTCLSYDAADGLRFHWKRSDQTEALVSLKVLEDYARLGGLTIVDVAAEKTRVEKSLVTANAILVGADFAEGMKNYYAYALSINPFCRKVQRQYDILKCKTWHELSDPKEWGADILGPPLRGALRFFHAF